ncbi:AAA family ATPase [Saccharomonospora sp. NPDC006951]
MLVGRQDESRHIRQLCAAVENGLGRVLLLRGEPGIGKSALLSENTPDHQRVTIVRARGFASETDLAFAGLHQLLEPFLPLLDGIPGERAQAVRIALGLAGGSTTDLAVCAGTLALLRAAAARRPVLFTIDDAHQLDAASQRVVFFCCRRVEGGDDGIGFLLTTLASHGEDLPDLVLSGLGTEAAAALLAGYGWRHGETATATLIRAARGNPLVLGELARHNPAESVPRAPGAAALDAGSAVDHLFGARLAALPPAERTALRVVAADDTGRADVIARAGERLGLPRDVWASEHLASLLDIGEHITFAHPLLRSANGLSGATALREAHAALAGEWAALGEPSRAMWHRALAANEPDEALASELENSASSAERRGGTASAAVVMRRSALLSPLPSDSARRSASAAHYAWKSGEAALARQLLADGGDGAVPGQRPVRALFELFSGEQDVALGYLRRCAGEAGGADAAADLRFMATGAALYAGRLDEATELAERIACEHDDPAYRRYGRWLVAALDDRTEAGPRPWQLVDEAPPAIARSGAHRWLFPMVIAMRGEHVRETHDLAVAAYADLNATGMLALLPMPLSWLVEVEIRLGKLTEAGAHAREGLRLATDVGQPPRIADFHALLASLAAIMGDTAETRKQATAAKGLAHETGNRLASARATWALGSLALAKGEHDTACALLTTLGTRGLPQCHEHIARLAFSDTVEAHLRAGEVETASGMVNRFTHWARDRQWWVRAHLHGCAALLAEEEPGSAGDTGLADKLHRSALASVSADSTPFEVARLSLRYGEWLRRQRRVTEATEPLRMATNLFTGLGARLWAERAGGELRACGTRRGGMATPASWPAPELTEQERRVAELAAMGLSNKEIGARLYLSHRTVGYHLHKIFPKLGITARAQLRQTPLAPQDPQ